MATTTALSTSHRLGQLRVGGDWACAHGDLEALRFVARQLAYEASDPLHHELLVLADACHDDPDHAIEQWLRLKRCFHDVPTPKKRARMQRRMSTRSRIATSTRAS